MAQMSFRFMSWNLKFFGKSLDSYKTTMKWIAKTIINNQADVVVILEVYCGSNSHGNKIGYNEITQTTYDNLIALLRKLQELDAASKWDMDFSGGNASSAKLDAYAFFWKTSPTATGDNTGEQRLTKIEAIALPNTVDEFNIKILRDGVNKEKNLGFAGDRRPGASLFRFTTAANQYYDVLLCGYHAPQPSKKPPTIKNAIADCINATRDATAPSADRNKFQIPVNIHGFVIGGDLNINYTDHTNWFDNLDKNKNSDLKVKTAITKNGASSLFASPLSISFFAKNKDGNSIYAKNAYDNFLYQGVSLEQTGTKVIDVIEDAVDKKMKTISTNRTKRTKRTDEQSKAGIREGLYLSYYPKSTEEDDDDSDEPGAKRRKTRTDKNHVSDHFPIIGVFKL